MSTATSTAPSAAMTAPAPIADSLPLNVPLAPRDIYGQKRQEDRMGEVFHLPPGWVSIQPFSSQHNGLAKNAAGDVREFYLDLVKTERGMAIQMTHYDHQEAERQRAPLLTPEARGVLSRMDRS